MLISILNLAPFGLKPNLNIFLNFKEIYFQDGM